jgi:predicted ATPase/DNA-binding SARP family transcriptional activator
VEFRVLGPLEVVVDGAPVELTARQPRALLVALLLRANEVVAADTLADALWNDSPPASAASVLRVYVSQLRRALGDDRIVTRQPGYLLVVREGELDAARFESLAADARAALEDGGPRLARALFTRALDLWRGDALAGLADEGAAHAAANRLDELRLACLEGRLAADLELGRHAEALPELERLAAAHPLREGVRAQLMLALYRAGRQADALAAYRAGRDALVGELGLEPGGELRALERRILEQDPALDLAASSAPASVLPVPPTPTVGREREVADIVSRLRDGRARLLTLVGPGGIGKTRLAVEAAHALAAELADGAVLVDLAPVGSPELLLPAIGGALGLREEARPWQAVIAERLRGLQLLLVLDNLEHLVDGAAALGELLAASPQLVVLATSRRALRLEAEQIVEVQPLDQASARKLLAERVAAAGVRVGPGAPPLDAVSTRLEGLPLAIELAAPWFRTVRPDELLRLLDSRLHTLGEGARDRPERQRTMRSALDWSFDLLSLDGQRLLGALAACNGGFTSEAALAVGGEGTTLRALAELVDASLVRTGDGRQMLLDVVREYAGELASADESSRERHARYFLAFAEEAESHLTGAEQGAWLALLERDHDNLRAALDWSRRADPALELSLVAALGRFWGVRGYVTEGLERLVHAADRDAPGLEATRAKALRAASALALLRGEYPLARSLVERSLELYELLGDAHGTARCLINLGAILHAQGELDLAASTMDACIAACEALADARLTAVATNNRGDIALSRDELEIARTQFARSLELLRELDDLANVARALYNLGAVALEQGRLNEAGALLAEGLELSHRIADEEDTAWCLIALAAVAVADKRPRTGAELLGFAVALLEKIGATMKLNERRLHDRTQGRLRDALGAAELAEALDAGAALELDDVVVRASLRAVS